MTISRDILNFHSGSHEVYYFIEPLELPVLTLLFVYNYIILCICNYITRLFHDTFTASFDISSLLATLNVL